jgi:hypothetical protein
MTADRSILEAMDELGDLLRYQRALDTYTCMDCGNFATLGRCPSCQRMLENRKEQ